MRSVNKKLIRRAFNSATKTYDVAADWQKNVGNILLDYLKPIQPQHKTILDLGAGTGYMTKNLQQQYPDNQYIVLDIAEDMLQFCRQHFNKNQLICADAETLALSSNSIDIIVSNMVLHWCRSLTNTLKEQSRILIKGGLLFFSILGPESLLSLKTAWQHVDHHTHINDFPDVTTIQKACYNSGFSLLHFERHEIQKNYRNVFELMNHLKATGAKNISANKPKGLIGKQKIQHLNEQYKNPIHYEIFTGVLQK